MVHLRKKLRHHFAKKKHHYGIGLLGVANCLIIVFGIFLITRGVNPHTSELAFIEKSVTGIGSVVPASCDSNPPINHPSGIGNCPAPTVSGSVSPASGLDGYSATLGYTSTNATRCTATNNTNGIMFIGGDGKGPTSYSFSTNVNSDNRSWTFTCYNAVGVSVSQVVEATITSPGSPVTPTPDPVTPTPDPVTPTPSDCALPWGGRISNGALVTAYQFSSVTYGSPCPSETRACSNGTLTGSYGNQTCSTQSAPLATVSASVSPTKVPYGGIYNSLQFSSTNAVNCTIDGSPAPGTSYTWPQSGPQYTSVTWTFVCYNAEGRASAPAIVTLTVDPPPTVTAVISPVTYVNYGGTFNLLSYTSSNTTWCDKFDDGVRDVNWDWSKLSNTWPAPGVPFYGTKTWTFNCYNNWPPGTISDNSSGVSSRLAHFAQRMINVVRAAPPFGTASVTLNVCPKGYLTTGPSCRNPNPEVSISTPELISSPVDEPYTFTSNLTDASGDTVIHNFEWIKPNGEYNWQGTDPGGTVTYVGSTEFTDGAGSNSLQAIFTPSSQGPYKVHFAAKDNTFSNFNGQGPRWTYSPWTQVNSIRGVSAIIYPNLVDSTRLKWECFNATRATLATTNGPANNDFTNRTTPPSSGNINPSPGATYTLTCINTASEERQVFSYTMPVLTSSNIETTTATINWNCNNTSAESITLARFPGGEITVNSGNSSRNETDLSGGTEYLYTLKCFNGPDGSGNQIGSDRISFFTKPSTPPANLVLGAWIHAKSTDTSTYSTTQPITALTGDGSFDSWSYKIWDGTAASCTMSQRNDGGAWYPDPEYASDPGSYTFSWNALSSSEKSAFAASFANKHDWKLTCYDAQNNPATLIWSLVKSNTFPTVIDASLNLDCDGLPPNPTIALQCVNSDWYELKNGANAVFSSGVGPSATVPLMGEDVYKVNCFQGGPTGVKSRDVFRAYSTSMCTTRPTQLTASPLTILSGGVTTLTWDISQPTSACTITATPVCSGTCSQGRIDEAAAINQQFLTGQTDANDPFSLPGIPRTVMESIQSDAFNNGVSGKALGKKTIRLKFTTDITIRCDGVSGGGAGGGVSGGGAVGTGEIQKVRILVSNENEG